MSKSTGRPVARSAVTAKDVTKEAAPNAAATAGQTTTGPVWWPPQVGDVIPVKVDFDGLTRG